jgi:dTDP-4-dehydrorhamnose reductase
MTRVLLLGARGMLGSMVARVLAEEPSLEVIATSRHGEGQTVAFEVGGNAIGELLDRAACDWIVNALGVLERRMDEGDPASVASAIEVNAAFPHRLAAAAEGRQRIINIATDGVFAGGDSGPHDEQARRDADGVYALSKRLGEVRSPHAVNLRCSIVGPEHPPSTSLLGWALSQSAGSSITGYTNHQWNGVTTLAFAKVCAALIDGPEVELPPTLHLVPGDSVNKAELLRLALDSFGKSDVRVVEEPAPFAVDRTLSTVHPQLNGLLWAAAGYPCPPTIKEMMTELAAFGP